MSNEKLNVLIIKMKELNEQFKKMIPDYDDMERYENEAITDIKQKFNKGGPT